MGRLAPDLAVSGGPHPDPSKVLAGRRVLVTRAGDQAGALVEALRAKGADVVVVPTVEIAAPLDDRPFRTALAALAEYDWLLLTSANAVRAVAAAVSPLPRSLKIGSAGPATTTAFCALLPEAVLTAEAGEGFGAAGLARSLSAFDVRGSRMLLPVSDRSAAALASALRERGARVDVVVAYRTIVPEDAAGRIRAALEQGVDAVTFASPSAIEAFAGLGPSVKGLPVAVIGPTTAAAARDVGFFAVTEASSATADALAEAVEVCLGNPAKRRDVP